MGIVFHNAYFRRSILRTILSHRHASSSAGGPSLQVFNDKVKQIQRERSARNAESSRQVDYLRDEVANRLCERLLDIKRHFPRVLDLGANACNIARSLSQTFNDPSQPLDAKLSHLTSADASPTLLHRDAQLDFNSRLPSHERVLLPPQGKPLPFKNQSFDAALSSISMHWINDLPHHLTEVARILKPDSPFLGAMLGGDSLFELRTSLQLADLDRRGGVSTHVSPLADVRDMGGLLTRAGFKLLTVDVDDIVVDYPDTFALMMDLQAMGESNAALTREMTGLRKEVLLANEAIYRELHADGGESIPATFRIIYVIGWTPGEGQPEPEKRGSGQINLADVLGTGGSPGEDKKP